MESRSVRSTCFYATRAQIRFALTLIESREKIVTVRPTSYHGGGRGPLDSFPAFLFLVQGRVKLCFGCAREIRRKLELIDVPEVDRKS
jgi:hypothetical protein